MEGAGGVRCEFCNLSRFQDAEIFIVHDLAFFAADSFGTSQVLPGAGIVSPTAHRETPFDLTIDEWVATRTVLHEAKPLLESS